jgi:hypothetical protein
MALRILSGRPTADLLVSFADGKLKKIEASGGPRFHSAAAPAT